MFANGALAVELSLSGEVELWFGIGYKPERLD